MQRLEMSQDSKEGSTIEILGSASPPNQTSSKARIRSWTSKPSLLQEISGENFVDSSKQVSHPP